MAATTLPPRSDPAEHSDLAVENARLRLEMQRLRAETDQRAAELTVISAVQQGLASKLDMQAIIDLVGDKLCEVLHSQDLNIRLYDRETDLVSWPYFVERWLKVQCSHKPRVRRTEYRTIPA